MPESKRIKGPSDRGPDGGQHILLNQQIGSMDKLLEYYKKDSEQDLRSEMFELNNYSRNFGFIEIIS